MVLRRRINYQWRIFLPVAVCLWAVIFGMFHWQEQRVRIVRNEMAFDQLSVVGSRIVSAYERGAYEHVDQFASFTNKFYDASSNYDEMNIWILDNDTDSLLLSYGNSINRNFKDLPDDHQGTIKIADEYLSDQFDQSTIFLYSQHYAPKDNVRIFVFLPYTKRLQEIVDSRTTYFWLIFVALGLFVTIITYISSSYFSRNLKILRNFAIQASSNPNFTLNEDQQFPHDELGDISRQIVKIYNQRTKEIERSEREHKVALNAIEEKNRIKRELTGNINHELKTPVGVIQGYLDTIVNNPDMDAATRDRFIQKAQDNIHRLTSLINDITAITKLESGGKLINITEINFHDLTFSFENFLKEGNVLQGKMTFTYDLPLNCLVFGNESLLQTILLNLVKNSVAYSEGTECHFECVKEDQDFYYFRYYDNGIGVAPEHLPHIFERFYRVNAGRSRNAGGTGLGLAIVEVTIESLGGKIDVQNRFPSGLEYTFSLMKYKKKESPDSKKDK